MYLKVSENSDKVTDRDVYINENKITQLRNLNVNGCGRK